MKIRTNILFNAAPVLGGGGAPAPEATWHSSLPEDIRTAPALLQIKGKDWSEAGPVLAKSYLHAQSLVGADRIQAPQKNWGDKEYNDFYNKIGRPEKPDGYKFENLKLGEGQKLDDAKLAKAREHFHKMGLTPAQAEGMLQYYVEEVGGAEAAQAEAAKTMRLIAETKLKQDLGGEAYYQQAVEMANSVITRFGTPDLQAFFQGNPSIANHPDMVKFLHGIASMISEDTARGAGPGSVISDKTSAMNEITRLTSDADFQKRLSNKSAPGHDDAVTQWLHLHKIAHPGKVRN